MGARKGKATAFTLVINPEDVRARRKSAPAGHFEPLARRKEPRRRPDYLSDTLAEQDNGRQDPED